MADNSVISQSGLASLFGIPGYDQRAELEKAAAFKNAQLTPMQQLSARAIGSGKAAGRELAGLFGVEDPIMKEQSLARQVRGELQQQGLNPNTPEYWDKLVGRLGEVGATRAQAEAANIGLQVKEKVASIGQKTGENLNTLLGQGKYTPESIATYGKTRNPADLVLIDTKAKGAEALLGGGKYTPASVAKYQQTGNIGDLVLVKGPGEGGPAGAGPVGKSGAWRDADGIIYSASEMQKQRAGFQQGEKLLENLNAIQPSDVKSAESWIDWTQGENRKQIGGKVATKTVAAQAKINAAQLLKQIESLPPGSASNADMIAAKSSFPGYGDANALQAWIDDTRTKLQSSLNRQADQYGFKQRVPSGATTPAPAAGSTGKKTVKFSDLPDSK